MSASKLQFPLLCQGITPADCADFPLISACFRDYLRYLRENTRCYARKKLPLIALIALISACFRDYLRYLRENIGCYARE